MSERVDRERSGVEEHPALLPWYVEGNLDSRSARDVERHLARCAECREEVEALASMRASLRGMHAGADRPVTLEELLAYEAGDRTLAPAARERVEQHLAACSACREDLAALRASRGNGATPRVRVAPRRPAWIVAAAMLVLGVALSVTWLTRPSPTAAIIFLPTQRGAEEPPVLQGHGPWTITVVLPFDAPTGTYRSMVETEDGTAVDGPGSRIASSGDGRLSVHLPALPRPGLYRLVVRSETGATGGPYSYPFRLVHEASSNP